MAQDGDQDSWSAHLTLRKEVSQKAGTEIEHIKLRLELQLTLSLDGAAYRTLMRPNQP